MEILALIFIGALVSGMIGVAISEDNFTGFWYGFFLGPIGWIISVIKEK